MLPLWIILAALLFIAGIVAAFAIANRVTRQKWRNKPPAEIADILERFIDGTELDDYFMGSFMAHSNNDERVHEIWRRCQVLIPARPEVPIPEVALPELRGYVAALKKMKPVNRDR